MDKKIKLYLSGSVPKPNFNMDDIITWGTYYDRLANFLYAKGYDAEIFDPSNKNSEYNKLPKSEVYQVELNFIRSSDIVLVELSQRRGLGVGVEMYHAKLNNVPVISLCPNKTVYRDDKSKYLHPFVEHLSNYIVDDFESMLKIIETKFLLD